MMVAKCHQGNKKGHVCAEIADSAIISILPFPVASPFTVVTRFDELVVSPPPRPSVNEIAS